MSTLEAPAEFKSAKQKKAFEFVVDLFERRSALFENLFVDLNDEPPRRVHQLAVSLPDLKTIEVHVASRFDADQAVKNLMLDEGEFWSFFLQELRAQPCVRTVTALRVFDASWNATHYLQLTEALSNLPALEELRLTRCSFESAPEEALFNKLQDSAKSLRVLDFSESTFAAESLKALTACSDLLHNRLTTLNLLKLKTADSTETLADSFLASPQPSKIEVLKTESTAGLDKVIASGRHSLTLLDLSRGFANHSYAAFLAALETTSKPLEGLVMHCDCKDLFAAGSAWFGRVRRLSLRDTREYHKEVTHQIVEALAKPNELVSLSLETFEWDKASMAKLAEFVKGTATLKRLRLHAAWGDLQLLAEQGLRYNTSLEDIDFANAHDGDFVVQAMLENQDMKLKTLLLEDVYIHKYEPVAAWLRSPAAAGLTKLSLARNNAMTGARDLLHALVAHPALEYVDLTRCDVDMRPSKSTANLPKLQGPAVSRVRELRLMRNDYLTFSAIHPYLIAMPELRVLDLSANYCMFSRLKDEPLYYKYIHSRPETLAVRGETYRNQTHFNLKRRRAVDAMLALCLGVQRESNTDLRALSDAPGHDGQDRFKKVIYSFLKELAELNPPPRFDEPTRRRVTLEKGV